MAEIADSKKRKGIITAVAVIAAAVVLGLVCLWTTNIDPRTDDANVIANYIGIAPEVEGRIVALPVVDNQLVHKGALLYVIDPKPYEYRLQQAVSARNSLEEQIIDERRKIGAQTFNVTLATQGVSATGESISGAQAAAQAAQADIPNQEALVKSAEADYKLASNNLTRAEPLLVRQFVTVQQIDQLRTAQRTAEENLSHARAMLASTQSKYQQALAQLRQSAVAGSQQKLRVKQSELNIDRLQTLLSERLAKAASVDSAKYDLQRCRVYAPFDARVTNLNISVGQYARIGVQVFTLIDTTAWWVVGNFKETQLRHVAPGMPADLYLMTRPDVHFQGVVESIGFGVTPENISAANGGIPSVNRTLNWVRLAQRFPVRVRVLHPSPELYRLGASATAIIRSQGLPLSIPPNPNVTNVAEYGTVHGNNQPTINP
ncbi:MAG TPA: biotin/lipoyl-binding protein [Bryobacteraceae bacterium]|nr:biotin/lipoyl-binding protein [Bryobacteraceae bacterium]